MRNLNQVASRDPFSSKILGLISLTDYAGISFAVNSNTRLRPQHRQAHNIAKPQHSQISYAQIKEDALSRRKMEKKGKDRQRERAGLRHRR